MAEEEKNKPSSQNIANVPDGYTVKPGAAVSSSLRAAAIARRKAQMRSSANAEGRVSARPANKPPLKKDTEQKTPSEEENTGTLRGPSTMRGPISMRPATSLRPEASGRPKAQAASVYHAPLTDEKFIFEGKEYQRESLISSTTGEAEIFLVKHDDQQYVLKLYYRGYYPSPDVLEVLKENVGNNYVVDVLGYGDWTSSSGEERFGVLMPFYSGGVLKGGEFRGKSKALEKVATQAMEAINYCHSKGILHKDIKPNNFIYTDSSREKIVLADFGIASVFARDSHDKIIPFVNINQNRTYIYASPEIFNLTVQRSDGRVEVEYNDVKSDFFALGMTLLVLWMGEAPFALLDERSLLKLKRGDRSGLPYPEDIPKHTRNLIKGLTLADPEKRWGYREFEKWKRGEDVDIESNLKSVTRTLRILYNGSKKQVATSLRQLAEFMLDDPALGEQYLYSGKISKWMIEAGYPEWQMRIDSIVNKQYPKSRRSGLLAACYKMNPDLPFVGIKGNKCYKNIDIARELSRNAEEYSTILRDWDAPLYIYFSTHNINIGAKYQQLFKSNPWTALWRMIYAFCPQAEFPFWSTKRNGIVWCATVEDLVEEYGESSQDRYAQFNVRTPNGKYTPHLLGDECFVTWLAARDEALATKIKNALADEKSQGTEFYTYIFYLLAPQRNFFYQDTTESYYTAGHIGELINQDLIDYLVIGRVNNNQHFYNEQHRRSEQLAHYHDTKLYYFFKSKETYQDKFEYIDRCFDLHSKANRAKPGPYNSKLATLKVCHAFAGHTFYYFPTSDITVNSVEELSRVPKAEQQEELHKGFLMEWLAVQYQENPNLDTTQEYAYEHKVIDFMQKLEEIDPKLNEVERFQKCFSLVESNAENVRASIKNIKKLKYILLGFAALVAVMISVMLLGGVHSIPNDDTFTYNWRTMAYIALPLFVLMVIPPIQSFVNDCTKGLLGSPLLFALVVSNFIVLGWEALRLYIMPYSYISMPILFGLIFIWIIYSGFVRRRLYRRRYAACINPDFATAYAEPLQYTWRDANDPYKEFDSSVMKDTKEYSSYLKALIKKLRSSVKFFTVLVSLMFLGFCFISTPVSSAIYTVFPALDPSYNVNLQQYDDEDSVLLYICTVDNALSVRETPSSRAKVIGTVGNEDILEVVGFEGDYAKILYDGRIGYVLKKFIQPFE